MKDWRKYNGALIPSLPPHVEVEMTGIMKNIHSEEAYFARWTTDFDCKKETEFWYVICDETLEIEDYSKNTRSKIRRGLKNCEVKLINKEIVLKEGFESYNAAFLRYNTYLSAKSEKDFHQEINVLGLDWEFWGIYNNGNMIGYCQNKISDSTCDYSTIKFHPDYLNLYPSYGLFYSMNYYYLNKKGIKYVNDGARSISHETNIQSFLIQKFKFRKAYCKLTIIYSPKIKFALTIIYPFKSLICLLKFGPFIKINILINQEKIIRSYEKGD